MICGRGVGAQRQRAPQTQTPAAFFVLFVLVCPFFFSKAKVMAKGERSGLCAVRCSLQGAFSLLFFSRSRHSPQCTVRSAQHVWRGSEWRPAMRLAAPRCSFTTQLTKSRIQAQKKWSAGVQAKSKGEKPDGRRSPFAVCALCPLPSETPANQQNTQNLDYSYHKPTLPLLRLSNFCPSLSLSSI